MGRGSDQGHTVQSALWHSAMNSPGMQARLASGLPAAGFPSSAHATINSMFGIDPPARVPAAMTITTGEEEETTEGGDDSGLSGMLGFQRGGALVPSQEQNPMVLQPIISSPIPTASLGDRMVPPPSEAHPQADYDFTLNTLKPSPIYPGANFANALPQGYNVLGNIQENQGMSPFDQSQRSMITGTTTGQLSQSTANPGNQTMQGGLSSLGNSIGTFS
jgi:hypothetical protein|tara:strand:- start:37 stop:693 length:657 start_codon:yes stop_codon:yes gene_type:complete